MHRQHHHLNPLGAGVCVWVYYGFVCLIFLMEYLVSDIVASTMFLQLIRVDLLVSFRPSKTFEVLNSWQFKGVWSNCSLKISVTELFFDQPCSSMFF